jgi:MFS family permease
MAARTLNTAMRIAAMTGGVAMMFSGISWMSLFGGGIVLLCAWFSDQVPKRTKWFAYVIWIGFVISIVGGGSQLAQAWRHGFLWQRVPPPWSFEVFFLACWLGYVVREFWWGRSLMEGWQLRRHHWMLRRLKALPPEKREEFLSRFDRLDRKTVDSFRKDIGKDL